MRISRSAIFLILSALVSRADTVLGTGVFLPVPVLGAGQAYWDNASLDGSQMNIGYFLTGTGGFTAACSSSPLCGTNYLGNAGQYYSAGPNLKVPDQPTEFSFLRNSTAIQITLLGAYAGLNSGGNQFSGNMPTTIGYYDANATTLAATVASEVTLWASGTIPGAVGTTVTVSPYANYGLYETVCTATVFSNGKYLCTATQTYFSNSTFNPGTESARQHFALFSLATNSQTYFVGFEDLKAGNPVEGLGDYNDVIIEITSINSPGPTVPEPTTFTLIGAGLLVLAFVRWRRPSR